jgi:hypothetical protein
LHFKPAPTKNDCGTLFLFWFEFDTQKSGSHDIGLI